MTLLKAILVAVAIACALGGKAILSADPGIQLTVQEEIGKWVSISSPSGKITLTKSAGTDAYLYEAFEERGAIWQLKPESAIPVKSAKGAEIRITQSPIVIDNRLVVVVPFEHGSVSEVRIVDGDTAAELLVEGKGGGPGWQLECLAPSLPFFHHRSAYDGRLTLYELREKACVELRHPPGRITGASIAGDAYLAQTGLEESKPLYAYQQGQPVRVTTPDGAPFATKGSLSASEGWYFMISHGNGESEVFLLEGAEAAPISFPEGVVPVKFFRFGDSVLASAIHADGAMRFYALSKAKATLHEQMKDADANETNFIRCVSFALVHDSKAAPPRTWKLEGETVSEVRFLDDESVSSVCAVAPVSNGWILSYTVTGSGWRIGLMNSKNEVAGSAGPNGADFRVGTLGLTPVRNGCWLNVDAGRDSAALHFLEAKD